LSTAAAFVDIFVPLISWRQFSRKKLEFLLKYEILQNTKILLAVL
jgi:hypothetical protein